MVAVKKGLDGRGKEKERQVEKNDKKAENVREKKGAGHKGELDLEVMRPQLQRSSKKLPSMMDFVLNICPIPAK